jgi:hypothetical protein
LALFLLRAVVSWYSVLVGLMLWLALLGLIRRLLTLATGPPMLDPLLLVAPVVWAFLFTVAVSKGAFARRTPLSTAVLALGGVTVIGSLNASQQPIIAGFWVGRVVPTAGARAVMRGLLPITTVLTLYGLLQLVRFLPWDQHWLTTAGYGALNVGGTIRPFSTSSSASEFAFMVAIGIVAWFVVGSRSRSMTVLAVLLLATMLFLESSRCVVVMVIVALVAVTAARRGVSAGHAVVATVIAVLLVPVVAEHAVPETSSSPVSSLVNHQVDGLANPLDRKSSTFVDHLGFYGEGLRSAVEHPLGLGLGASNLASVRFGGEQMMTEQDLSNVAVSLGMPGLLAFVVVACIGFARVYRWARWSRDPLALVALGVMILTFGQWLNGGQYGVAWLPWLLLGVVDRCTARRDTDAGAIAEDEAGNPSDAAGDVDVKLQRGA